MQARFKKPSDALIALGSNLGDRQGYLCQAVGRLREIAGVSLDLQQGIASLYETDPVGVPPDEPPYLNSACTIQTTLPPQQLMCQLVEIESLLGRTRGARNASRTIDLDLLLYGDVIIHTPRLIVPHPRLHERRFVLEPLAEIAEDVMHPLLSKTIVELRDRLRAKSNQRIQKIAGPRWVVDHLDPI